RRARLCAAREPRGGHPRAGRLAARPGGGRPRRGRATRAGAPGAYAVKRAKSRTKPRRGAQGSKVIHFDPRATRLGIAEHFRVGERERAERVLDDMAALGLRDLRVCVSWADSLTTEGKRFYDWLLPTLAARVRIVPCIAHTPPSLGVEPRSSAPPRDPRMLSDWLDVFLTQHGSSFEHVELWSAPNSLAGWDARLDPDLSRFAATIGGAASWARQRGKKT